LGHVGSNLDQRVFRPSSGNMKLCAELAQYHALLPALHTNIQQ